MRRGRPKKTVSPPPDPIPLKCLIISPPPSSLPSSSEKASVSKVVVEVEGKGNEDPNPGETLNSNDDQKLWVDVLKDNRNPAKGRSMKFIAPQLVEGGIEVSIEEADIVDEILFWRPSLVLYALGGELSMHAVKNFMIKNWNFVQLPDMYYHEGYFILRFSSFRQRDDVLMKGPYSIRNMPLLIHEWRADFNLQTDLLRTLPIWVKLPNLPLYLWGETSLNKIGSALGIPIVTDECTANRLRISYARILVEMDITKELPSEIIIKDNMGEKMQQSIDYEWRPVYCGNCQRFGHNCDKPKQKAKIWQPKAKPPEEENKTQPTNAATTTNGEEATVQGFSDNADSLGTVEINKEKWTTVNKSGKDRGKGIMIEDPEPSVLSTNGFDALGILNDLLVLQNPG
ncbi:uncharacterized protein LOC131642051 [Vicia villosa]|uniref:uncharacterized protein LOC131642051 n=1 Tax=Vicia villosa TaxID=3911 RepID=UPI00273BF970|nr:uncharacterized protein LOC131642051 [Vicia villosa]